MDGIIKQFMKHSVVGVFAFLVDFGVMVLLHEWLGLDPLIASVFSFTAGAVASYWGSMRYVFSHKEGMSRRREFIIYMVLSIIGLGLNSACMYLGKVLLASQGIDYTDGGWYMIVKVVATAIVTFYNFFSRRIFLDAGDAGE